jgi:GNAT superfamily N-acetyltransferase
MQRAMTMQIRTARLADAPRLAELSTQLGYPSTAAQVEARLARLPADGSHIVYVAEQEGGSVVGWVHVHANPTVETDARAEVAGLVVDLRCRNAGIGRRLMEAAENWAREKGLPAVTLRSNIIREGARRFYESLGYTLIKTQHAFRKELV